jgi:hypothetical protein
LDHTSLGVTSETCVQTLGTHRMLVTAGGSCVEVTAIPSATNPSGGTAAHANTAQCFHSWPQTCLNRTGCGNRVWHETKESISRS